MKQDKKARLESQGWKVGSASDFLELSPEETMLVEIKLALSRILRERRQQTMTQDELASQSSSSQPRVARAESADDLGSTDLLLQAILATGATPQDIGQVIANVDLKRAEAS